MQTDTSKIVAYETVKAARDFLLEHPEELGAVPPPREANRISEFLGWPEERGASRR